MKRILFLLLTSVVVKCTIAQPQPQYLPPGFGVEEIIFTSSSFDTPVELNLPTSIALTSQGNFLFIGLKSGKIQVANKDAFSPKYVMQSGDVLDISTEVGNWRDFGLMGMVLDPSFSEQTGGYIYIYYVVYDEYLYRGGTGAYSPTINEDFDEATIARLARYTVTKSGPSAPFVVDYGSRTLLLGATNATGVPILHQSHAGGGLAFAADGTLLVSTGDGASYDRFDVGSCPGSTWASGLANNIIRADENVGAFRSQMLTSLNGKILRINPQTGEGISSNPFFEPGNPNSTKSKVWALGLRNPLRISVKPGAGSTNPSTGDVGEIFISEVGWYSFEELNISKAPGMNFGWPLYDGMTQEYSYVTPIEADPVYGNGTQNPEFPAGTVPSNGGAGRPRFYQLLREDNQAKDNRIWNPGNPSQLLAEGIQYIHARPAIDWGRRQAAGNPPDYPANPLNPAARVPRFNTDGSARFDTLGRPGTTTTGETFIGNSSTGGIWYVGGKSFPAEYNNMFLMADYGAKWMKKAAIDFTDAITAVEPFVSYDTSDGSGESGRYVQILEHPVDGSLIVADIGGGRVRRIQFGANIPPVAQISSNDPNYSSGQSLTMNLSAAQSFDPTTGGSVQQYNWDFGDGNTATQGFGQTSVSHSFSTVSTVPMRYVVKLTVVDNEGASSLLDSMIVSLNNTPPAVTITKPIDNSKYSIGGDTTYVLEANVTDVEHDVNTELSYAWQTVLKHNNHQHSEPLIEQATSSSRVSKIGCNGDTYHWLFTLTVTDPMGLTVTDSSQVYPDCAATLPIFLHRFSVSKEGSANLIKWTTQLESNLEYFEVERSSDGVSFWSINQQLPANVAGTTNYSFRDNSPLPGISYYRLKIVEHGNVIRYSVVIRVSSAGGKSPLVISPNPVVNNFSISYDAERSGPVTVQIKDVTGKILRTLNETVTRGSNVIYIQNLAEWRAGVYLISVQQDREVMNGKFVKAEN